MLMLRESPIVRRAYPLHEQCSGESKAVNVFLNEMFLVFFSFPILFIVVSMVQGIHIHGITEHITHLSSATNDAC